jgi:hypothetical protein
MANVVINLNSYKSRKYDLTYKEQVSSVLDTTKDIIRLDPDNTTLHAHMLTTIITNMCTWVIKLNYFNNPGIILKNCLNRALTNAGHDEL